MQKIGYKKKPLISVIIPVYNVEKEFPYCIESVLNQTYRNIEIVLIDDGSSDASPSLCDKYAKKDKRIKCKHQENFGVSKARNLGLELATGDYYHFLDSDDYLELDAYEFMLNTMAENGAEAVSFEYYVTNNGKDALHKFSAEHYGLKNTHDALEEHLLIGNSFLCTKLLPAHAIKGLKFLENIYRDEDTYFGWQALARVKSTYFSSRPLLHYVQSADSACRGSFRVSQLSAIDAIPIWEKTLNEGYDDFLERWRAGFMNLMITLYCDMYLDGRPFKKEKKRVYDTFLSLNAKVDKKLLSDKNRKKFGLFKFSPELFGMIHKKIHHL